MKYIFPLFLAFLMLQSPVFGAGDDEVFDQVSWQVRASDSNQSNNKTADVLVISCIDCRYRDEVSRFLQQSLDLTDRYDETALPGASSAYVTPGENEHTAEQRAQAQQLTNFNRQSIEFTVKFAHEHHHINRVIFLDHDGCGAYGLVLGDAYKNASPQQRYQMHCENLLRARSALNAFTHSQLKINTYVLIPNVPGTMEVNILNTEKVLERPQASE